MIRLTSSILVALLVPITVWIGGFDLNERGAPAAFCFAYTVIFFGLVYMFPGWKK